MKKVRIGPKSTFNFNKQLLFAELGAFICAPLVAYLISYFFEEPKIISSAAIVGAVLGGSLFWLSMRAHDRKFKGKVSSKRLINDIMYFTPAAFMGTVLVYYPSVYFISKYLLTSNGDIFSSVFSSQIMAFTLFLCYINIYRYFLAKITGKVL
ncbi:MAG: hypothetical protein WDZ62_01985 [Candidatus Pacearchaeota archaeon]